MVGERMNPRAKKETLNKRQRQALETRKKLFDTAVELFATYGYESITVDDIVAKAHSSKGSFYSYFRSKESIIVELIRQADDSYEKWYEKLDNNFTSIEKLLRFAEVVHSFTNSLGISMIKVFYMHQINFDPNHKRLLNDENRQVFNIAQKIIARGQEIGEFRSDISSLELARMFTFWMRSILYNWCLYNGEFNLIDSSRRYFKTALPIFKKGAMEL